MTTDTQAQDAGRLMVSAIAEIDTAKSLLLAADMACSDLDCVVSRTAIKDVLRVASEALAEAHEQAEAARAAMQAEPAS